METTVEKVLSAQQQADTGKNVHADVSCQRCSHKGAVCLEVRGRHWMTMQCLKCDFVFSIDGE